MNVHLAKVAVIRDPSVPPGQPAPMWLNCPCGAKPPLTEGTVIVCPCGEHYERNGRVLGRFTWTTHTFICTVCKRLCRASQEAIDEQRAVADCAGLTDAQVAEFEFCLKCVAGIDAPGEKVPECEGEEDAAGNPSCYGPDVRPAIYRVDRGEWQEVRWCKDCRDRAAHLGYDVAVVENGIPVVVGFRGEVVNIPLANVDADATGVPA